MKEEIAEGRAARGLEEEGGPRLCPAVRLLTRSEDDGHWHIHSFIVIVSWESLRSRDDRRNETCRINEPPRPTWNGCFMGF